MIHVGTEFHIFKHLFPTKKMPCVNNWLGEIVVVFAVVVCFFFFGGGGVIY